MVIFLQSFIAINGFTSISLYCEDQAGTSCKASLQAFLIQNNFLKMRNVKLFATLATNAIN